MTQIIESKLFLGDIMDANDKTFLIIENVTTIICLAKDGRINNLTNISLYNFDIDDNNTFNISSFFDSITSLIHDKIDNPGSILVNCVCGISRSPTIIIAYLMKYEHFTLKIALKEVHHVRSHILPNENFIRQLITYEHILFGKNSLSLVDYSNIFYMTNQCNVVK